eukprot:CAMPEP_0184868844 /NCGR_PEP_ID=MMETSP0580-20130426/31942_1 /TAXON_ID=1118495 /ORGANISM="Dactyliosolen fragilissimus" /LENGTH=221 /DNA_ID=CAMNT_0027369983 /DNA_START=171 /DNA_END=839 /DNA_ORIENTATION=+
MTLNSKQSDLIIGIFFISAFPLYGGGAALLNSSCPVLGLLLMLGNSLVVIIIGRMLQQIVLTRPSHLRNDIAAHFYLFVRLFEAILLAIAACITYRYNIGAYDATSAATAKLVVSPFYYNLSMVGLGIGSIPLLIALMGTKLIPSFLGWFGIIAYALLACGNVTSAITDDKNLGLILQLPGALFELSFAIFLIVSGFAIDNISENFSIEDQKNESTQLMKK